jgi:hypothetical protein
MTSPQTKYARSRDGDVGPMARVLERLASFNWLILFVRRGFALSDPLAVASLPTWEAWTDDVRGVLDAVSSERAVIFTERDAGRTRLTVDHARGRGPV